MTDDLTHVYVAQNALVAFIELITCTGCTDIKVNQADLGWQVTYKTIFTREVKACDDEPYVLPKNERLDAAGPLSCQSCIKIKACKQIFVETGIWPVSHDCFVPDRVKKYPQFEMDSCEECNAIHSCIARYDMDRANWRCAKGKVHLNFTEIHDAPCTPQMIAEADCEGDRAKCGGACYAKSRQKDD